MGNDFTFDMLNSVGGVTVGKVTNNLDTEINKKLDELLETLDKYQRKIVLDFDADKTAKVIASAGSGKTFVLVAKALKLVIRDKVDPKKIVLITFTNKASKEIRARYYDFFEGLLSEEELETLEIPNISTIHSFAYSVLKSFGVRRTILSEYQSVKILKDVIDRNLGVKVNLSEAYKIKSEMESIVSNGEGHFAILPVIDDLGNLVEIKEDIEENEGVRFLDMFSRSQLGNLIEGEGRMGDVKEGIVEEYASKSGLSPKLFTKIMKEFYETKFHIKALSFIDMQWVPFLMMASHSFFREIAHKKYKYFVVDEAQDSSTLEIAFCMVADEDTLKIFDKKWGLK